MRAEGSVRSRFLFLVAAISLFFAWVKDSRGTTILTTADTYVVVGNGTKLNGLDQTLVVGDCAGNAERRAFLRFSDDVQVLADRPAKRAVLRLWAANVGGNGTINVHVIQSPWTEETLTGTTQPLLDPLPKAALAVAPGDEKNYLAIDVTGIWREWQNGTPNYGIALLAAPGSAGCVIFDSTESSGASHDPQIELIRSDDPNALTSLSAGPGIAISGSGNSRSIANTGDTNPNDDITSLSAGAGISISGSGNSRMITNTGDPDPNDDITALVPGNGISISGSGNSRLIGRTNPVAGRWAQMTSLAGIGRYVWSTEALNTDVGVLERTPAQDGIQLNASGLYLISANVAVSALASGAGSNIALTVRSPGAPATPVAIGATVDMSMAIGGAPGTIARQHVSAIIQVSAPMIVEVWSVDAGNRGVPSIMPYTTLSITKLD